MRTVEVEPTRRGRRRPTGSGSMTCWGTCDEWVGDWYGEYPGGAVTDPAGPGSGSDRVNPAAAAGSAPTPAAAGRRIATGIRPATAAPTFLGFRLLRTE